MVNDLDFQINNEFTEYAIELFNLNLSDTEAVSIIKKLEQSNAVKGLDFIYRLTSNIPGMYKTLHIYERRLIYINSFTDKWRQEIKNNEGESYDENIFTSLRGYKVFKKAQSIVKPASPLAGYSYIFVALKHAELIKPITTLEFIKFLDENKYTKFLDRGTLKLKSETHTNTVYRKQFESILNDIK